MTDARHGVALALLGLLALLMAGVGQWRASVLTEATPGFVLLLSGALLAALAAVRSAARWPLCWLTPLHASPPSGREPVAWRRVVVLLLATGIGASAAGTWWRNGFVTPHTGLAAEWWLDAVLIAWLAVCLPSQPVDALRGWVARRGWRGWALPLGVFLAALAVRLWDLAAVPYGVWFDEAETGLEARRILAGAPFEPLSRNFGRDPLAFFWLTAGSFALFGDALFSLRLVGATMGAFGALFTALLGRQWFGWRVGLAAGLFLAFSRWHLDFSRFAMVNVSAPMVAALTLWLLSRAVTSGRWSDWALTGLATGFGLHAYAGVRALLVLVPLAILLAALRWRWQPVALVLRLSVVALFALLAGLPVAIYGVRFPDEYGKRVAETSILSGAEPLEQRLALVAENARKHALMFHVAGDRNGRHNVPAMPMLDPVAGLLAAIGLGWCAVKLLDWRALVLGLWLIGGLSNGILTLPAEAPQAARTIVVTPALAVLSAIGLVLLADRLALMVRSMGRVAGRFPASAFAGTAAAWALGWSGALSVGTYFTVQAVDTRSWLEFSPGETFVGRYLRDNARSDATVLLSQTLVNHPTIRYLAPQVRADRAFDGGRDLPLRQGPTYLFLEERDQALWAEVPRYQPEATSATLTAPRDPRPLLMAFAATAAEAADRQGLDAELRAANGAVVSRRVADVGFGAGFAPPLPAPFWARWRSVLAVPEAGDYAVLAPPGFVLRLNGRALPAASAETGGLVSLPRGNVSLELEGEVRDPTQVSLRWVRPGGNQPVPLSPEHLFAPVEGGTGLVGEWFPNDGWRDAPTFRRAEPVVAQYVHILPLPRPYTVEWTGFLRAPTPGSYGFGLSVVGRGELWIGDQRVLDAREGGNAEVTVELSEGLHPIRVRFLDDQSRSQVYLRWQRPASEWQAIPGAYLYGAPIETPAERARRLNQPPATGARSP